MGLLGNIQPFPSFYQKYIEISKKKRLNSLKEGLGFFLQTLEIQPFNTKPQTRGMWDFNNGYCFTLLSQIFSFKHQNAWHMILQFIPSLWIPLLFSTYMFCIFVMNS